MIKISDLFAEDGTIVKKPTSIIVHIAGRVIREHIEYLLINGETVAIGGISGIYEEQDKIVRLISVLKAHEIGTGHYGWIIPLDHPDHEIDFYEIDTTTTYPIMCPIPCDEIFFAATVAQDMSSKKVLKPDLLELTKYVYQFMNIT